MISLESKFTGKERDAETGLDYFGLRYRSAAQGRFTLPDPNSAGASLFNPESWNGYSYVNNQPLNHIDPDGDVPIPVITGGVGAAVGGLLAGGAEALSQFVGTGGIQSWGKIGTSSLGGAIAGGIAGSTFGVGAGAGVAVTGLEAVAVNASSSVIGGIVQRQANESLGLEAPTDGATKFTNLAVDAATGVVGGVVGSKIADKIAPIPNVRREIDMLRFGHRRSTRPARIQAAQRNAQQQAFVNSVVGGVAGGLKSEGLKGSWLWLNSPNPQVPAKQKEMVTSRICFNEANCVQ